MSFHLVEGEVVLYDSSGNAVSIISDSGTYRLSGITKVLNTSGTQVNPATQETLADVKTNQESVISTGNSSTSQLGDGGTFVGTGVDCLSYSCVAITVHSDKDSAVDGMKFQFSIDNANWDDSYDWNLETTKSQTRRFQFPITARYFRVNYTNGSDTTTEFRVQTILHRQNIMTSVHRLGNTTSPDRSTEVVKSGIIAQREGASDENFIPIEAIGNSLKVVTDPQTDAPLHVVFSAGRRSYYHLNLVAADGPAEIDTGADEPYAVGNTTLTIDINTSEETSTFATRAAQAGIHYSAPHPAVENSNHKKLKVSIDGGVLKEVVIAEDLTSGAAIASALQVEIRANVENGTSATVEYNTTDYPFRYVFKSGTTGASSIMHVEKGGDDLAKDLYIGRFGGTEHIGLAADDYWAFEVIAQMEEDLPDVVIYKEGDGIHVQTIAGGSGASLQVTAGGANTALQFPTSLVSGVTGSGDDDLAVDGSSSSIRYSIVPPTSEEFVVEKLTFFIRDNGSALNKFGGMNALTNGVKLEVKSENLPLIPFFTATTNADIMSQAAEGERIDHGFDINGEDLIKAIYDFSPGLRILQSGTSNVYVTVQDDLTTLDSFFVRAIGWVEAPPE